MVWACFQVFITCWETYNMRKEDINMKRTNKLLAALLVLVLIMNLMTTVTVTASAAVSDVKPGNWAYNAVQYNVENKLIAVDYSTYNMNAPAPRQDVAYAMYKLTNGKDVEPSNSGYTQFIPQDMKNSPDKYKYSVQWAVEKSIIAGTNSSGTWGKLDYKVWFSPTAIVTREQMATLLFRMAHNDGLNTTDYGIGVLSKFTDASKISTWAMEGMAWSVTNKLMNGVGNNKMSPKTTLTYAQLAQVMMNYGKLKAESQAPIVTPDPTPDVKPTPTPDVTGNSGSYYNQVAHPENANKTDWLESYQFTDLSGPWDNVQPVTELPIGGYKKNGHRYNKYGAPLDGTDGVTEKVDGMPTNDEKKAFILINQHRINNGLEPLKWDQAAQVIAETRAIESRNFHTEPNTNIHEHTRPNGDELHNVIDEWRNIGILKGKSFNPFCHENGYQNCQEYWENDYGYHEGFGPVQIVKGWIESKGHDAALKWDSGDYGAVAASHFDTDLTPSGDNTYYWYYNALDIYE